MNSQNLTGIRKGQKLIKITALSFAKLMKCLLDGPVTYYDMAEETGLHRLTCSRYCAALKKEGVVYVAEWMEDRGGRRTLKGYKIGNKPDAARPPWRRTAAEVSKVARERRKMAQLLGIAANDEREAA